MGLVKAETRQLAPQLKPRGYQSEIIDDVAKAWGSGDKQLMVYAPTGSGKTITAALLFQRAWISGAVLPAGTVPYFICDKLDLITQSRDAFRSLGFRVRVLRARADELLEEWEPNPDIVVASVQSMARRYGEQKDGRVLEMPRDMGMAVIDEAHYLRDFHRQIIDKLGGILTVGLSATPLRAELGKYYKRLIHGPNVQWCIDNKFLVPPKVFSPKKADLSGVGVSYGGDDGKDYKSGELTAAMSTITGDIVTEWELRAKGLKTLCFCCTIAHADDVARQFRDAGHRAEAYHTDKTGCPEPEETKAEFVDGDTDILVSVMKISIGFDYPAAACLILARPTMSESLYIQMIGRGLRPHEPTAKEHCLVLDHAGNVERHGLPQDFQVFGLDEKDLAKRETLKKERSAELVPCLNCSFLLGPADDECPECGHPRKRRNQVQVIDGELTEYGVPVDAVDARWSVPAKLKFYREVIGYCRMHGKKPGRAFYVYKERFNERPPINGRCENIEPLDPSPETNRYMQHLRIKQKARISKERKLAAKNDPNLAAAEMKQWLSDHKPTPCEEHGNNMALYKQMIGGGGTQYKYRCNQCRRVCSKAVPHDVALTIDPNPATH